MDDNETNREILREEVASWGCNVQDAADAESALALMRKAARTAKPIAVAITDRNMPGMGGLELALAVQADPRLRKTVVVMLSSAGDDEPEKVRQAGIAVFLTKPVRQSELFDAIVKSLGGAPAGAAQAPVQAPAPAPAETASTPDARILVAEDNEINREVAVEILRLLGHECDCVANGQEAVSAAAQKDYDLILMDCQMPEMDGFTATAGIRAHEAEQPAGGARTPIVALTANAMQGDRERCLAVGMDDYLTKPLAMEEVARVIQTYIGKSRPAGPPTRPAPAEQPQTGGEPVLDQADLLKRCGGNAAFVLKIIAKYRACTRSDAREMKQAFEEGKGRQLASVAHRVKGASLSVSADAVAKAAAGIEAAAQSGDMPEAGVRLKQFQEEIGRFEETAARLLAGAQGQMPGQERKN